MGSLYIQSGEYATYGLASTTAASDVATASSLIDAYLRRPEGLVWTPDGNGWPCFMAALTPTFSLTAPGAISPAQNVVVPVTGGMVSPDLVGEVLVLDRANANLTEAVVVTAVGTNTVTLAAVTFAHSGGAVLEAGLTILEERALPSNRAVARVSRAPVARMVAVQGRYAYGRRSQQQAGVFAEPSILASVQAFGGPPVWYPVNVADVSVSSAAGEVWIPPGALVANFSDVRMRYVAGYPATGLPGIVKTVCAALVQQIQEAPELAGNVKSYQSGGTKIERFADSMLDAQSQSQLASFQARSFY